MRETFEETWIFQLVTTFIFIFVAFLALIISYARCFKVKNEVISIIEKYEGFIDSKKIIADYLTNSGYQGSGKCTTEYKNTDFKLKYIAELDTHEIIEFGGEKKAAMCVYERQMPNNGLIVYKVVLFYNFNLPIIGLENFVSFEVKGNTNDLKVDTPGLFF